VPPQLELFKRTHRIDITWPQTEEEQWTWEAVAAELAKPERSQVLCIVNLKRHAAELLERLADAEGLLHLSTNLCPMHRKAVLQRVRESLEKKLPCRLVSTQCVEAGVDLDFPEVWRAMGPLEAMAQAAGRCNRHDLGPQPG